MKRAIHTIAWFCCGGLVAVIGGSLLSVLWHALGWRKPVSDCLVNLGYRDLAAYWGLVWINLPDWFVALLLGVGVGRIRRGRWIAASAWVAAGFILVPHLMFVALGPVPWSYLSAGVAIKIFAWDVVAVPLLFGGAWLGARLRRSTSGT